jgi:hypothetical protein
MTISIPPPPQQRLKLRLSANTEQHARALFSAARSGLDTLVKRTSGALGIRYELWVTPIGDTYHTETWIGKGLHETIPSVENLTCTVF